MTDWRDDTIAWMRELILAAEPGMVETRKWKKPSNPGGVPVFECDGIVCTTERYKDKVKLTFAHGAEIADPAGLLDPGNGKVRAALDLREGEKPDPDAVAALVRAAVAFNRKG